MPKSGCGPIDKLHSFHFNKTGRNCATEVQASNSWKTIYSHPLVCFTNRYLPDHLYVYHTNERDLGGEGDGHAALLEFVYHTQIIACSAP